MKIRLVYPAVVALIAGILLVSCSGDSDSDESGEPIDGAQTGGQEEPDGEGGESESPEGTPSDGGIDRPVIELPDDMTNVFEAAETGDETQDAILSDLEQQINAVDMAIAESDPGLEAVEFYTVGEALVSARQYIRGGSDNDRSWAGAAEYYDFTVSTSQPGNASVTYCVDSTGVQTKELATGEVLPKPEDAQNFHYVRKVLKRNENDVWQVSLTLGRDEELDRQCER